MVQDNVQLFLSLHIQFLKYLGIWMTEKPSKLYDVYRVFVLCLHWSIIFFILIYLWSVFGDLEGMTIGMYVLFTQAATCLKVTSLVINRKVIVEILEFMNCDTFVAQTDKQQMILSAQYRKMRRLYYFLLAAVTFNLTEWLSIPILDREGPRAYPFTMWMPGNIEKSPDYELGYLYQIAFSFIGALSFMTIDAMTNTMISFGCAQLDIVKDKIKKIQRVPYFRGVTLEERDGIIKENDQLLTDCIRHHQAIIRFIASVVDFFNVSIFFQLSGSVAIVCMIAFRLSVEPPNSIEFNTALSYMMTMLAQLYFYCWSGNELTTRSEELRDEFYQCPWYEQDVKFKRKLCFAMECMKKPIVFQAGHYITLSRPTFIAILRCSYSYFAVLNQANDTQ